MPIDKLIPQSNLRQVVDSINALIDRGELDENLVTTLRKTGTTPVKVFTSTYVSMVTGEVYDFTASGKYYFKTDGSGSTKYILKDGITGNIIDTQILNNNATSITYTLSAGDQIFISSSPNGTSGKINTSIYMGESMYDMVLYALTNLDELLEKQVTTDELLSKYLEQVYLVASLNKELQDSHSSGVNHLVFSSLDLRLEYIDAEIASLGGGDVSSRHNWLDLTDYGVVGNGSTDDASKINAAITQFGSEFVLYMPKRTYAVKSTIYIPDNVKLICDGVIKSTSNTTNIVLIQGSFADVKIEKIEGSGGGDQTAVAFMGNTIENSSAFVNSISKVSVGFGLKPSVLNATVKYCNIGFGKISAITGIYLNGGTFSNTAIDQNTITGGVITATSGIKTGMGTGGISSIYGNVVTNVNFVNTTVLFSLSKTTNFSASFSNKNSQDITMSVDNMCDRISFVTMDGLDFSKFTEIKGTNVYANYTAVK